MSVPLTQALGAYIFLGFSRVSREVSRHTFRSFALRTSRSNIAIGIRLALPSFQIGRRKYAHPVGRHTALSRALTSTAPVGLYPLTEMSHCSSSRLRSLRAGHFASSGRSASGAGPFPGNPRQQNHLLR